jgi:hypothetical protein
VAIDLLSNELLLDGCARLNLATRLSKLRLLPGGGSPSDHP